MEAILAALIGALATVSAALLQVSWPTLSNRLKRLTSRRPENIAELHRIEVFQTRNSSDTKMAEDLVGASKVCFFGVSQKNLHIYLETIFSLLEAKSASLDEINVYFASETDGPIWEGPDLPQCPVL